MKTVYFNVLSHISTELSTKSPYFVLLAKKKIFFLAKKMIFKFCLLLSRGIKGGMKNVYFNVLSHLSTELSTKTPEIRFASKKISGKKFDFRILLITFKRHHRRYETRLFYRSIPSQNRTIYKRHPNFVLKQKKISGKKFDYRILLITFKRHHSRYGNRLF